MIGPNANYLPRLDHLRLLAACLVVAVHFIGLHPPAGQAIHFLLAPIRQGHTGVTLFFVLSGFLFTVISFKKSVSYPSFLLNRILRIYPLYTVGILSGMFMLGEFAYLNKVFRGAEWTWLTPYNIASAWSPFATPGAFIANDYFAQLWSISVELQFYLVFPILKIWFDRWGVRAVSRVPDAASGPIQRVHQGRIAAVANDGREISPQA